ncbi:nicotinate-nucleotide--dimethylbenzimidazole phosphoribosyltransferase [Bacillus sp. DNRA2]|uniref:nicotinate-nucleotide--dimethylbenzimidazole phosphoribosyltransferase n=1 Tax=Bacillus sp. DNRA2 TaxID=2723053 RepID=UPI00145E2664|nr:nicotinate-nucleotide--dimethylbenzimidazole phosphoribosyltransferase [Bacillus sp. DNRA2]NMD69690.1 nicotinate-nucleotide--dimethylbenzimidazole phosphoribosyltransferase [Bacillus sp. DNRA2]
MIQQLTAIQPVDKEQGKQVAQYIDTLTKPIGSLGRLEELAIQLGEITGEAFPTVTPPAVITFAADHGIVKEGVSAYPQEVTAQMVLNFLSGGAGINVFSRQIGAKFEIVDVGVAGDLEHPGLTSKKVRYGTGNFLVEDAMTRDEVEQALAVGYERAQKMFDEGAKCLIVGEMGIGNTTPSSAIIQVLSGKNITELVGSGTGIDSDQVKHKQAIIMRSIEARQPDKTDAIDLLVKLGGLEIAAMTGAMLAACANRVPILLDGFICTVSGVLAAMMNEHARDYMIVGHRSVEIGHDVAINLLGKKPLLDLGLRLGEGTGAAVAFPILQSATLMLKEMATFASAGVSGKE